MEICENEYCGKTYLKAQENLMKEIMNRITKVKKGDTSDQKDLKKVMKQSFEQEIKKNKTRKGKQDQISLCKKGYCNPECKNTLFQKGDKLPKGVFDNMNLKGPTKKIVKSLITATRKRLFGKKKDILKNNFYEGLSKKEVTKLKKEGAISGCTVAVLKN